MADDQDTRHEDSAAGDADQRITALRERFGDDLVAVKISPRELDFQVAPGILPAFFSALREDILAPQHGFSDLCGVDRGDMLEAIYRFYLIAEPLRVVIRIQAPRNKPVVPSISALCRGALWPERELVEMYGFEVTGHPDMRPLLLPEGWEGYPLRKDYKYPLDHPWMAPDPLREDPAGTMEGS